MTMTTTSMLVPKRQVASASTRNSHPLLSVMAWEVRRVRASRLTWGMTLGAFALFLFILWTQRSMFSFSATSSGVHGYSFSGSVAETSAQGFLFTVPGTVLL